MRIRRTALFASLVLLVGLTALASANLKVLVKVGDLFYGDVNKLPDPNGTRVCAHITLDPFGAGAVDVRMRTECGVRTTLVASTMCAQLKTLIVNAAVAEYPALSLVADDIAVQGCPQ